MIKEYSKYEKNENPGTLVHYNEIAKTYFSLWRKN